MPDPASILVVDDEVQQREIIAEVLGAAGHAVGMADGVDDACRHLRAQNWDMILTDWRMPGGGGERVLADAREALPDVPVVVMTAYGSIEGAVDAVRRGACDYLSKPFDKTALLLAVEKGLAHRALTRENRRLKDQVRATHLDAQIVGRSAPIQELKRLIAKACAVNSTVLIGGDSGTGKELVARAIHHGCTNPQAPFVAVNCAAIPAMLIESELFGHERGAFTGAERQFRGRFEQAEDGTLLLDEISAMPLELQGKLLRVLEERALTRVGGTQVVPIRARIVAATNRDLREAVRLGEFREDLYFRLHVVPITVPPLRERQDDIPLLVAALLTRLGARLGGRARRLTPDALACLQDYGWPGNVRELENLLERLWVTADTEEIDGGAVRGALHLNGMLQGNGAVADPERPGAAVEFLQHAGHTIGELEARLIREALERTDGHISQAAELLGLSYKTMQYRIRKHGIRTAPQASQVETP